MKIVTSLSFQGQCRDAFEFYAKVLGGKITAAVPYGDAPPGMPNWESIAKTGAAKAAAGDVAAAKASCKSCHDQYKARYKAQWRDRAF